MLVVKIELHSAITGNVKTLYEAVIANVGGGHERGNYRALFLNKGVSHERLKGMEMGEAERITLRRGEVNDYPRQSYNAWRLVSRALRSAFPEEA